MGIGVEVTFEVIAAAALLRKHAPDLRVRVVNVTDLMILANTGQHPHALSPEAFESLFTLVRPVHFNYHGYPIELQGLLFGRPKLDRIVIERYSEEGTTTSPFDVSFVMSCPQADRQSFHMLSQMMLCNRTDRFSIGRDAIRRGAKFNPKVLVHAHERCTGLRDLGQKERDYICTNGKGNFPSIALRIVNELNDPINADYDDIFDTPILPPSSSNNLLCFSLLQSNSWVHTLPILQTKSKNREYV